MQYPKIFSCVVAGLFIAFNAGCGPQQAAAPTQKQAANNSTLQIKDGTGRTVVIPAKPQRVVSLSPSYLELIDAVGGTVVGRPTAKNGKVPASMAKATEVGLTYNVNMELVVGLKPDLVLAGKNQHAKFVKLLESNKIPTLEYNAKTIAEVKQLLTDLGKIYGTADKAQAACAKLDSDIKAVKDKLPKEKKRIAIMFATANSVTVSGSKSIAGNISDILGFENVAAKALQGKSEKTPYSMEALLEQNPDIIFITSMGKPEEIENRLQNDFKKNPAWNSLKAVQQKHIYVLPENLFLLNPGIHYPEAVQFMAKQVYPNLK